MAPQQSHSFARQLSGDFTPWDLGRGTGPLAGDRPPGVPGGCTTNGCQQHLPPGKCPLVLTSPAVVVTGHQQHLCLESQVFSFPVEVEGVSKEEHRDVGPPPPAISQPSPSPFLLPLLAASWGILAPLAVLIASLPCGACLPCQNNDLNIATVFQMPVCSTSGLPYSCRIPMPLEGLLLLHYFPLL